MSNQIHAFFDNLRGMVTGRRDEKGASAVEYGLLVAGIAAVIVAIVFLLGGVIQGAFQNTCNAVKTGGSSTSSTC